MREPKQPKLAIHAVGGPSDPRVAAHLSQIVQWVHEASNPFADWYFGSPAVAAAILEEWVRRPSSELYIGRAAVAFDARDASPMGCVLGLDGQALGRCRSADFLAFCEELGDGEEAAAVLAEVVPAARALFPPVAGDAYYISRVATAPAARGRGVARVLVSQVMEGQRARGFQRFFLDVGVDNGPAIRAYEAAGFRIQGAADDPQSGLAYYRMGTP